MKMSKRVKRALRESVAIWERRAKGERVDENCPLCEVIVFGTQCKECPVARSSSEPEIYGCNETPYWDWDEEQTSANAQKELDFLKSLLP